MRVIQEWSFRQGFAPQVVLSPTMWPAINAVAKTTATPTLRLNRAGKVELFPVSIAAGSMRVNPSNCITLIKVHLARNRHWALTPL